MQHKFSPLPKYSDNEVRRLLKMGTEQELAVLALSVGAYEPNWKIAQDICLSLCGNPSAVVRANASLGLAYIARTKGRLEKHRVKPVLIQLLRTESVYRWRIEDSIEDINLYLGWHLAAKALKREKQ